MRTLYITFLIACLTPAHHLFGQEPGGTPSVPTDGAGFTSALFDTAALKAILSDAGTVGIRFYNVLVPPDNRVGSAMAVGIRTDGSEVNKGKAYRIGLGFIEGMLITMDLTTKEAKNACAAMQASGHPSYSASFTRTELETLMELSGCQAVQVTPDVTATRETTMRLTAMKVVDDKAVPLGSGPQYERVCGFPCPSVCGAAKNYVYQAPR